MLFLLTGDIQIGKTRWLEALIAKLGAAGVSTCGILSPGIWIESTSPEANAQGFEKLGIDIVLLPQGTVKPFAKRRDIAIEEGSVKPQSQSSQAGLAWEISDDSIRDVNWHLDGLLEVCAGKPSFLVVDELGRLELLCGKGFTSALKLLELGPTEEFPHALAVVRAGLVPYAMERLGAAWDEISVISPDDEGEEAIRQALMGA